ncbi:MAG TPA: hypothetical protein VKF14_04670 [Candidatus Dormibacteraeota bacterium]|nr:hypothetical protein [Candidatus Dormibacteraeota bacterium]
MLHRHLTLERYELLLEEDASAAARLREKAKACPVCGAALAEAPLAPLLAAWAAPVWTARPVEWKMLLRRAATPSSWRPQRGVARPGRFAAVGAILLGLTFATALPAAASTGPNSALFPVRGVEEEARWRLTPEPNRAELDADLAAAYLWQARVSAAHHDGGGYQAAMRRFFTWAERLRADIAKAPPAQRSSARAAVGAALPLVSPLATQGPDPAQARRAQSIIDDLGQESQGDDRQDGGQHRRPETRGQQPGPDTNGSQGKPSDVPSPATGQQSPAEQGAGRDSAGIPLGSMGYQPRD